MSETEQRAAWPVVPVEPGATLSMSLLLDPWRPVTDPTARELASPDEHLHPVSGVYQAHVHEGGAEPHRHRRPGREQDVFAALHGANLAEGL